MSALLVALVLAADRVPVAVSAFTAHGDEPRLGRVAAGLGSVVEADLQGVPGLSVRTEDELGDVKTWGRLKGARFLVSAALATAGPAGQIDLRVVSVQNQQVVGAARIRVGAQGWGAHRDELVEAVCKALGVSAPARRKLPALPTELLEAWGAALAALGSGEPQAGKAAVADVVRRWPDFGPAKARLDQLGR